MTPQEITDNWGELHSLVERCNGISQADVLAGKATVPDGWVLNEAMQYWMASNIEMIFRPKSAW